MLSLIYSAAELLKKFRFFVQIQPLNCGKKNPGEQIVGIFTIVKYLPLRTEDRQFRFQKQQSLHQTKQLPERQPEHP